MRVAMVCPYDLSRPGGVQGQALGLAHALREAGHDALVVAPDDRPAGWATGHVYVAGRSVGISTNGSVAPLALSPLAAARALKAVGEWRPDVVHLHEPLAPILGYGFVTSRRWPMVATFHRSGIGGAYRLAGPLARRARARIDVCCAVSEVARSSAAWLCGGSYEVLFNGVDVDRFVRARHRVGAAREPAVLFLGRHEQRKGLEVLLRAFRQLASDDPATAAVLWVAGEGPETASLRARYPASGSIEWLGVVSDDDAADLMCRASVVCAPSLGGESFGMVVLEAMAAGAGVVASDIPGYREAAAGHASLVPPGDVGALTGALSGILLGEVDGEGRRAAALHAETWSLARLADRYVDAYGRAVAHRGGIVAGQ